MLIVLTCGYRFCEADSGNVAIATSVRNIRIDGDFGDWPKDCDRIPIGCFSFGDAPESEDDLSAWFQIGFDKTQSRLVVAMEVRDSELIESPQPSTDVWSSQDKAGIYLQPRHRPGGLPVDESISLTINEQLVSTGWEGCSKRHQNKVCYEWSVDLTSVLPGPDQPFTIGLSAEAIDRDHESITVGYWSPHGWKQIDASRSGDVIVNVNSNQLGTVTGNLDQGKSSPPNWTGATMVRFTSTTFPGLVAETLTDDRGGFRVDLPAGPYEVSIPDWTKNEPREQGDYEATSSLKTVVNVLPQEVVVSSLGIDHQDDISRICKPKKHLLVGHPIPGLQQNALGDQAYDTRRFTAQNGLPSGTKNDLLVTPDGAVWIASERQLLKMLGGEIFKFSIAPEILGDELHCLHFDGKMLWIGTEKGVGILDPESNKLTIPHPLRGKRVYRIRPIHDGRLGIATDRGLVIFNDETDSYESLGKDSGLLDATCLSLASDRSKKFTWLGTEQGLAKFDGERIIETISKANGLPDARIWEITADSRGDVWFGANRSIFIWDGSCFETIRNSDDETFRHSGSIVEDQYGHLWCRTFLPSGSTAIAVYESAAKDALIHEAAEDVSNLKIDQSGNVWLLADTQLKQITTDRFQVTGSPCPVVFADPRTDRVWYTSVESKKHYLRCIRESDSQTLEANIETSYELTTLELSGNDKLWAGTKLNGVMFFDGERLVQPKFSFAERASAEKQKEQCVRTHVFQFYRHANGRIYCATNIGIIVIQDNRIVDLFSNPTTGLPASRIMRIDALKNGQLACASYSGVLFVDPMTGKLVGRLGKDDGLPSTMVQTVKTTSDGILWMGTFDGLYQYRQTATAKQLRSKQNTGAKVIPVAIPELLQNIAITDLGETTTGERRSSPSNPNASSQLFVTSSQGISRFDPEHEVAQPFFQSRNSHSDNLSPSLAIGKRCIWVGSTRGLIRYAKSRNRPTLSCDATQAGSDVVDGDCYVSTDQSASKVKLIAQSATTNHDQFVYRYRLRSPKQLGDWQTTTTNAINMPKLSSGDYQLQVVAFDRDLQASKTVSLEYHVSLPFVVWFRRAVAWFTSVACIVIGVLFVVGTLRTKRQLERRVEQRTAEAIAAHKETQRLELSLLHAQKLDSLGTMAAGIAHDFNNSLCAISSNMELALWHLSSQAELAPKYLEASLDATQQASELTQTLLSFAGKLHPKKETAQLQNILEDSLRMIRGVLPASVQIDADFSDEPIWCDLDATQMNQVIVNLAMNSRDAMPTGGRLHLEAFRCPSSTNSPTAVLRVQDTGHGMDNSTLLRIFEPFFTTKARGKGTGLGMSMVHSILAAHDGDISIESQVGVGTIVEIRLPTSPRAFSKQPEAAAANMEQQLVGTVIVADDQPRVRESLVDVLNATGLTAVGVENGKQLIEAAKKHRANLVLIAADVDMPEIDGITAVRTIRETIPNIPAIIFSGQAANVDDLEDSQTAFLQKPFRLSKMLEHAKRLSHQSRSAVA